MYNRYVPRPDGSFQRNWMPDPPPGPPPPCPPTKPRGQKPPPAPSPPPPPQHPPQQNPGQQPGILGFFRQLLPKDFCTEDLLIVLLLLLMSGDSKEDQNYALLTLALYLFL